MTAAQFEKVIKKLDKRFGISDNLNRPGLTNIFFDGMNYDLPVIPTHNIKEEVDLAYRYEFPNGMRPRHHTRSEVIDRLKQFLKDYENGVYKDHD